MTDGTTNGAAADGPAHPRRSRKRPRNQPFDAALGTRMRVLRLAADMNQTDLGRATGVTFQQVQKYENGRDRVAVSTLQAIADALGVHAGAFFDGDMPAPTGSDIDKRAALRAGAVLQRVSDPRVLKRLLALAEALSEDTGP